MFRILLILSLVVAGCGVRYEKVNGTDNNETYSIICDYEKHQCYEKARELCPNGYRVPYISAKPVALTLSLRQKENHMIIECK